MLNRLSLTGKNAFKPLFGAPLRPFSSSIILSSAPTKYRHDAPERDFVNFPAPRQQILPGKVRMGFIPNEWFDALYEKTGVTGPYVLIWGSLATILSKEYFVYWVDTLEQVVFFAAVIGASKYVAPKVAEFLDSSIDAEEKKLRENFDLNLKQIDTQFTAIAAERSLVEANKLLHEAKRENVELQLEASYRQRFVKVHDETKKRLDYHLAISNVLKRVEKQQMVNYILNEANKSIGAAQEKEMLQSCLSQLKVLSKKYANVI